MSTASVCVVLHPGRARTALEHQRQPVRREERLGPQRPSDEHVVVEVDELLGESVDVVQRRLDRMRVERRQRVGREDVGVVDDADARIVAEPVGRCPAVTIQIWRTQPQYAHTDRSEYLSSSRLW